MNYLIEPMKDSDAAEVIRIYGEGIAGHNATFEMQTPDFDGWIAGKRPDCRLVARRADGSLAGWAMLSPTSKRKVYEGVCEVTIYVSADAQGMGVGNALMGTLIAESEAAGVWTLYSSLFPENEASMRLHQRHGFRTIGRRERIAFHAGTNSWRDTVIMERRSSTVGSNR